jgi:hypothetical protein
VPFTILGGKLILANWNTSWDGVAGPMLAPELDLAVSVPAGQTMEF